jgi:5-keto 4-deoxyuronate isomerase
MPTYRNITSQPYFENGVEVPAFDTKETTKILTESSILIKISDSPYYNPDLINTILTFTGAGNQTVTITDIDLANTALIWNITGCNITAYLNSLLNTPYAGPLTTGQTVEIALNKSVQYIVIVADGAGTCQVTIRKRSQIY